MATTLHKLADELSAQGVDAVTLSAPQIRYRSTNQSRFSSCMDWRAEICLRPMGLRSCPAIRGGFVDFLTIRMDEDPIADILQTLDRRIAHFASLFDGKSIADSVAFQFEDTTIDTVLLLTRAFVVEPLRGHALGAWMAAETIHRMLDTFNGLVVTFPHPPTNAVADISMSAMEAVDRRNRCWHKVGLEPLHQHPGYLGHSTSHTAIPDARKTLHKVGHGQISAKVHDLRRSLTSPDGADR